MRVFWDVKSCQLESIYQKLKKKYSDVAGLLSARDEYYNGLQLTVIMKIKIYQNYLFNPYPANVEKMLSS
jgi:hypothetical protein